MLYTSMLLEDDKINQKTIYIYLDMLIFLGYFIQEIKT